MKQGPSFERIEGAIPEEEKIVFTAKGREVFDNQVFEDLADKEIEKTPEEIKIIGIANEEINKIRNKYGLEGFNIPPKNIHVIKEGHWNSEAAAFFKESFQAVALKKTKSNLSFANKIFHELIHFKSYNALQVIEEKENPQISGYRLGFVIHSRDGKIKYFSGLNEAITEETVKECFKSNFLRDSIFKKEVKQTKKLRRKYPKTLNNNGALLFDDDVYYAEKVSGDKKGELILKVEKFFYKEEREMFHILMDKILERNKDKFQNENEVFEMFQRSMFTGNILPIGKTIDRTFGKGTFRRMGELDSNVEKQKEYIENL